MQFFTSTDQFDRDVGATAIWSRISAAFGDTEGLCYYRHPVFTAINPSPADFTVLPRDYEPFVVSTFRFALTEIESATETHWRIARTLHDSPILALGDYIEGLRRRLALQRELRAIYHPYGVLAFPASTRNEVQSQFGGEIRDWISADISVLAVDDNPLQVFKALSRPVDQRLWALTLSVLQNLAPLNKPDPSLAETSNRVGGAIEQLEREIAILDHQQHKVAVEIAPGPQCIRGLAGTGKTVVLALKAANLHLQFPNANILFTFSTQSLYNQIIDLITKFYRPYADADPNWEKLQVRHGWGSSQRPGVYFDICNERGVRPLTLDGAKQLDRTMPFRACCNHALHLGVQPYYDFILIDEAQDFPLEFFRVIYDRASTDRRIYFAYDELQNLSALELPTTDEMFGLDEQGQKRVDLTGEYGSKIEKDFVLQKSYRCPRQVLVLAHGIGLGIKDDRNDPAQMIDNVASWKSFGYEVVEGNLRAGEKTVINRPHETSPNRIGDIYSGAMQLIRVRNWQKREEELDSVAAEVANLIQVEGVCPEQIVVTTLATANVKSLFIKLQQKLLKLGVTSSIPGLVQNAWSFGVAGSVTLATLRRAKGNEAPIIFIIGFEALYDYIDPIESRNKAFTAISRSKGWLRISGVGKGMERAAGEVNAILADDGKLCFIFPDMQKVEIRRLDASNTSKRRKEVAAAQRSARQLAAVDLEALATLDPETLAELKKRLDEVTGEH